MRVLICHERFLFRFGADRVFILLARGLQALGHQVVMMANRYDRAVVESVASRIIDVPSDCGDYAMLNEFTAEWLRQNWDDLFKHDKPDVVIVGGWPFFASIPVFREKASAVLFMDHGVVPLDGYPEGTQEVLKKLGRLRQAYLKDCSLIVGVSRFIVDTQSRADSLGQVPLRAVLNGADHMEMPVWGADSLDVASSKGVALGRVRSLQQSRKRLILSLGRWEPGVYKNSEAALDVLRSVSRKVPAMLLVLARPEDLRLPAELTELVYPLGFPDDWELREIMKLVDLGVSVSLWEGFNLPLAEMQWLGRACLAFSVGAHPEVILHPWYLCADKSEMAEKVLAILAGQGPGRELHEEHLKGFRQNFTWERAVRQYAEICEEWLSKGRGVSLIIDATNCTKDPANSGVVRVSRRLGRGLQDRENVLFVVWEESTKRFVLPTREEFERLGAFNGPELQGGNWLSPGFERRVHLDTALSSLGVTADACLLLPEVRNESHYEPIRAYARAKGLRLAAVFYDSIPILRPDLCNEELRRTHGAYMRGLAECDVVIPISQFSADCLSHFWRDAGIRPSKVIVDLLPGEFGGAARITQTHPDVDNPVRILCVSTLEPRKNHRTLIQACELVEKQHPGVDWRLTLVGNRYAGALEIAEFVEQACARNPRIHWLGIVDDATLHRLYNEAHFTVYTSNLEGFGLPIIESMWHGRPCICSNGGVMAELAFDGGCLTTNVDNAQELAEAIYLLATNGALYKKLAAESVVRGIKTWTEYTVELKTALDSVRATQASRPAEVQNPGGKWADLKDLLYPNCLTEKWQMSDSERLAMTALLSRMQPKCSIEIGTYWGGSLSLISQYSKSVISIDIDPEVPKRLQHLSNVSFLTGGSEQLMPLILAEAERFGLPVNLILIDGDHSEEGVTRDIQAVLKCVPREPIIILLHDSFNPGCRSGMWKAGWEQSPFCHWVDLDFVPGRVVSDGGPFHGELWGGLALAYFLPDPRSGDLVIHRSAEAMFEKLTKGSAPKDLLAATIA